MKKKILLFTLMCVCLISLFVVSSGAADWFSSSSPFFEFTGQNSDVYQFLIDNNFTDYTHVFTASYNSQSIYLFAFSDNNHIYYKNSINSDNASAVSSDMTISFNTDGNYDYSSLSLSSDGFVSSGFHDAIGFAGTIAGELLDNSTIILAIGLAVGVTLAGWGIGKVKSLIKGY